MNVKRGLRRLLAVAAVAYWIAAGANSWAVYEAWDRPLDGSPWDQRFSDQQMIALAQAFQNPDGTLRAGGDETKAEAPTIRRFAITAAAKRFGLWAVGFAAIIATMCTLVWIVRGFSTSR